MAKCDPAERYSAGQIVNQHPGRFGLPAFTAGDRNWPAMPVDDAGFKLKPQGFFDRNPTLNVRLPRGPIAAKIDQYRPGRMSFVRSMCLYMYEE